MIATLSRTSNSDKGFRILSLIISSNRFAISLAGLDAETLLRIEHGDDPNAAAFALRPAPGKGREGAALAGDRVEIAVDILDAGNAAFAHQGFVRRLPMRKILHGVAAGLAAVFLDEVRVRRSRSVVDQLGAERMIERL